MTLTAKVSFEQISLARASYPPIIRPKIFRAVSPSLRWVLISLVLAVVEIFFAGFI